MSFLFSSDFFNGKVLAMTTKSSQSSGVLELQGPVLVLGASGFIGANLFRFLLRERSDVYGTSSTPTAWRLEGLPESQVLSADLLVEQNLVQLLKTVKPKTV